MNSSYNIQLEALDPTRALVNNLMPHFGQVVEEVIDLRGISYGSQSAPVAAAAPADEPRERARGIGSHILTAMKFATTTGIVFAGLFIALNWGAYQQIFTYWYRSITPGVEKTAEQKLLASVLEKNAPSQAAQAFADEVELQTGGESKIDFRALEIAPSKDYLVVPKLSLTVPIVYPDEVNLLKEDWTALENQIQESLKGGVVHYPGTAAPGEKGNVFVTGHSSYYPWDEGRYKDVFALLGELKVGDEVALWHNGVRYVYKAYDIQVVEPTDTNILSQSGNQYDSILTLMTCTPTGTAQKRLIVRFVQEYPDPGLNRKMEGDIVIGGILKA